MTKIDHFVVENFQFIAKILKISDVLKMTIEKETPRTKERRSVAEKRLEYLEKRTPTPPSVPKPADIIQIPRHSPDSLIEVNLEVKKLCY